MFLIPRDNITVLDQLEGRQADPALVNSIKLNGVLNPLKVYRYTFEGPPPLGIPTKVYVILDGHRRLDAIDQLEIKKVPIEIMDRPKTDEETRTLQILLNRNRKDVKPTHVAETIMSLKAKGKSQKEIAEKFGLSEPEVSMYLTLHRGHPKLQKAVDSGRISLSAVEPLLTKPIKTQEELADVAIRQRTVRAVRALVKTHELRTDITAPVSQLKEDIDPLEYLALEEVENIEKALTNLVDMEIKSSTILNKLLPLIEDIIQLSKKVLEKNVPF